MGDRTVVRLTLLLAQEQAAKSIMGNYTHEERATASDWVHYTFYEVNYGELKFLGKLQSAGIAYDSEWDAGSEYSAGCEYCRFTDEGEIVLKAQYDNEENPNLQDCLDRIDDPVGLREYILRHKANRTILPWDDQERFGKIYRTRQLLIS